MEDVLDTQRENNAQEALAQFNFGDDTVTDQEGWNRDGIYWSKRIYGDSPGGIRFSASFGVQFDGPKSNDVVDQWCETLSTHKP